MKRRLAGMRAAIYARVSTKRQEYEMQMRELRDYAARQGWEPVEYSEKASSVKLRPEFERLMKDARAKKFGVVLVWKVDRFGRSLQDFLRSVLELDAAGVRFISITQSIDTNQKDPMSKFVLGLFGLLAQFEREMTVERVRAGVAHAKASGKHCGRPSKVFRRDEVVRMREIGMSWRSIGRKLGLPHATIRGSVRKVYPQCP